MYSRVLWQIEGDAPFHLIPELDVSHPSHQEERGGDHSEGSIQHSWTPEEVAGIAHRVLNRHYL